MDKEMTQLFYLGALVVFAVAWKPLHKRFRAWAILAAYFYMLLGVTVIVFHEKPDDWRVLTTAIFLAAISVFSVLQSPEAGQTAHAGCGFHGHQWTLGVVGQERGSG